MCISLCAKLLRRFFLLCWPQPEEPEEKKSSGKPKKRDTIKSLFGPAAKSAPIEEEEAPAEEEPAAEVAEEEAVEAEAPAEESEESKESAE